MISKLVSGPELTAVDLSVAKAHLRIFDDEQDEIIELLLDAATKHAERYTGLALVDQTWDVYLDAFPTDAIRIPHPPVIEIIEVAYQDGDGNEQIVSTDSYVVDLVTSPARITSTTWPTPLDALNAVRIRYRAGFVSTGDSPSGEVPADIQAAILFYLGTLYENRQTLVVGDSVAQLPWASEQLLRPHRVILGFA